MNSYQISALMPREIDLFVSQNYIDATTRAELDKLIALKARIAESNLRLTALKKEMQEISDDQKCLRENIDKLKSTPEAKQLITRYIAKADAQETRLEQIAKETKAAEAEQERLQTELAKSVKEFKFERKL